MSIAALKRSYWRMLGGQQRWRAALTERRRPVVLRSRGWCPTCAQDATFVARDPWLRDHFRCTRCRSIPRERALMLTIETHFPNWRELAIHESSPGGHGASARLARECRGYVASQYFPDRTRGSVVGEFRCEDLEALTFADESIDLHVTQDVLEHVLDPAKVFAEIARTLKPGGAHVFTVPLVNKHAPSKRRATRNAAGEIVHLETPEFHRNPISDEGSLVTIDWGFDICRHVFDASGLFTHVVRIDDLSRGIRAEYIEVLVTVKPPRSRTSFV